jgi:hypothetical protein
MCCTVMFTHSVVETVVNHHLIGRFLALHCIHYLNARLFMYEFLHVSSCLHKSSGVPNKSVSDLERIETEYIKNLQQQVYFLELEANYL